MTDLINHPPHYNAGGLEVIDIIEAYGLGYHLGNAVKYILRAGRKTADPRQDLAKSIWYLYRAADLTAPLGGGRSKTLVPPSEIAAAFGLDQHLAQALGLILQPYPTKWDMPDAVAQVRFALELLDDAPAARPANVLPFFREEVSA